MNDLKNRATAVLSDDVRSVVGNRTVLLIPICVDETFLTNGTTDMPTLVDLPQFAELGPWIAKMRVQYSVEDGAGVKFKFSFARSVAGKVWSSPLTDIAAYSDVGNGDFATAYYTTDANFWRRLRLYVVRANDSGAEIKSARLSAWLEVVLKT